MSLWIFLFGMRPQNHSRPWKSLGGNPMKNSKPRAFRSCAVDLWRGWEFFLGHGFLCVDIHQLLLDIIMIIKDTNHYHDYCYDCYKHYYDYHSYYYWCSRSIIISMILPNAEAWSLPLGVGGEKRPQRPQKALFGCSVWGWWLNRKKGGKTKGIHWYL